jgi:hypothetical protein
VRKLQRMRDMSCRSALVGIPRLYAGMRKAWIWNKYLAGAAEVREFLLPLPDVPKRNNEHHGDCADCCGSGWKSVMVYSDLYKRDTPAVTRCLCNVRPYAARKKADEADIAAARIAWAELVASFATKKTFYPKKPAEIPNLIPMAPLTAEQVQQRKPMERAEIHRVKDQLDAQSMAVTRSKPKGQERLKTSAVYNGCTKWGGFHRFIWFIW